MKYETIEGVKIPASKLVFGCANDPMLAGENVDDLLDAVFDMGINMFDTAENYGLSEVSLGHWLKKSGKRDQVVLISKGCHPYERERVTPEDLRQDIEQSMERLGTDYIDIYLLHRDNTALEPGPIVEILNEYKRAGHIGIFGGSNWTHERITEANAYAKVHGLTPFQISSPNFGLCEQIDDPFGGGSGCVTISGKENEVAREWYRQQKMPILAYASLGRGMFSGRVKSSDPEGAKAFLDVYAQKGYLHPANLERLARTEQLAKEKGCSVPQLALAWLFLQDLAVFPIVSAKKAERMQENVAALEVPLSEAEARWLNLETEEIG